MDHLLQHWLLHWRNSLSMLHHHNQLPTRSLNRTNKRTMPQCSNSSLSQNRKQKHETKKLFFELCFLLCMLCNHLSHTAHHSVRVLCIIFHLCPLFLFVMCFSFLSGFPSFVNARFSVRSPFPSALFFSLSPPLNAQIQLTHRRILRHIVRLANYPLLGVECAVRLVQFDSVPVPSSHFPLILRQIIPTHST